MADQAKVRSVGVQDSGNPVLDSVVNVMLHTSLLTRTGSVTPDYDEIKKLHGVFAELYEAEPRRASPPERKSLQKLQAGQ